MSPLAFCWYLYGIGRGNGDWIIQHFLGISMGLVEGMSWVLQHFVGISVGLAERMGIRSFGVLLASLWDW